MTRHTFVLGLAAAFFATGAALPRAASDAPTYRTPPKAIVDMLDAPPFPGVSVSPTRERAILFERRAMPPIRELAQPMFRLAGERMNPRNYAPHRSTNIVALTLVTVADGTQSRVTLPPNTTARPIGFSADGTRYAYAVVADDSVTLWALDIATARATNAGEFQVWRAALRLRWICSSRLVASMAGGVASRSAATTSCSIEAPPDGRLKPTITPAGTTRTTASTLALSFGGAPIPKLAASGMVSGMSWASKRVAPRIVPSRPVVTSSRPLFAFTT